MIDKYMSAKDVSNLLGLSKSRIKQARAKLNIGTLIGSQYVYTEDDIDIIRGRIGQIGRPSTNK